jgi:integrase
MKKYKVARCVFEYTKQDGSTTYYAEVRRKHAKSIRKRCRTLTDAKNWVRKTESAILDGQNVPDNKARKYTLGDLIDQYISRHLSKFPSRLKDQTSHLNWWKKTFGSKTLIEITPALIAEAKDILLAGITCRKQNRTNSTVNRYFSTLSRAFTIASQEWQWINENPFRRISKLKENGGRNLFLSREKLNNLLSRCKESHNPNLYGIVLIAASMGLRFGEIVNLRWRHIDFDNGFVTLEITKNSDTRYVPLTEQVATHLKNMQNLNLPDEFIFPSRYPTKRHPYSLIRKAFHKALQESKLQDFRFHDLRHTAASHMAMNGATQGELMEILGHRSPNMTRRYAHFSKEHISRIVQKTSNNLIDSSGETS